MRSVAFAAVAALGLAFTTTAHAGDPFHGHRHRLPVGPVYPIAPVPVRVVPHCDHYHVVPSYRPIPAPVYYRPVPPPVVVPVYPRSYGSSGFSFSLNIVR